MPLKPVANRDEGRQYTSYGCFEKVKIHPQPDRALHHRAGDDEFVDRSAIFLRDGTRFPQNPGG
jgi:hypothetical protein